MIVDLTRLGVLARRVSRHGEAVQIAAPSPRSPIGFDDHGQPIEWPRVSPERAGHVLVLGSSGAGKTVLVESALLAEVLAEPDDVAQRPALLVIDPKGDFQGLLHGLAVAAPHRLDDVRYLDPFSVGGFSFNLNKLALGATPVDIRALQLASLVAAVSTSVGAQKHLGVGARQVDVLNHVILGALANRHEQANVLWALDALTLSGGLKMLASLTTSPRARDFLQNAFLGDELRASCASRLRTAFAASEQLERLVTSDDCIQLDDLSGPGRICLVDLGRPVGGLTLLTQFWANLVCRLAFEHLLARPSPWTGHHCRVVIDEAQIVASVLSEIAETVLTTGRSKGTSISVITQGTALLHEASPTLLKVLLTNAPTKFIGRLAASDAELLSREQAPGRGIDESMGEVRGRFVGEVTNLEDREFFRLVPGQRTRFRSADVDVAAWQRAAEERAAEIETVRTRLALPSDVHLRMGLAQAAGRPPRERGRRPKPPAHAPDAVPSTPALPRSRWG